MRDIRRQASSKRTLVASYGGQELESAVLYFEDCIMRDIKESQLTEACRNTSLFQNCWNTIDQSRSKAEVAGSNPAEALIFFSGFFFPIT